MSLRPGARFGSANGSRLPCMAHCTAPRIVTGRISSVGRQLFRVQDSSPQDAVCIQFQVAGFWQLPVWGCKANLQTHSLQDGCLGRKSKGGGACTLKSCPSHRQ